MIEDNHAWSNIENFMAVVSAASGSGTTNISGSGSQQQSIYEDLALPGTSSAQSSGVLALPPPPPPPTAMDTSEPVMTVAIPSNMSVVSSQTGNK